MTVRMEQKIITSTLLTNNSNRFLVLFTIISMPDTILGRLSAALLFFLGRRQPDAVVPSSSPQRQCELEITGGTSWNEYLQNVSNPNYGWRCTGPTGTSRPCECQNPLVPTPNEDHLGPWTRAFELHLQRIQQHVAATADAVKEETTSNLLDVVFLGDSITEHWAGEGFGKSADRWNGTAKVFETLFGNATTLTPGSERTGDELLLGMPLGTSAEKCPNLLYRLQNGVLAATNPDGAPSDDSHSHHPSSRLDPTIWWILIGTNDRGGAKCLENHVIAGTIAIVEYIRQERPNAKIVAH
jgi:hypothetical protein